MFKDAPYVMIPVEVWNNLVVFSELVKSDVHSVMARALHEHVQRVSVEWSDERKKAYSTRLAEVKKAREKR
jgi:hypothetical protein